MSKITSLCPAPCPAPRLAIGVALGIGAQKYQVVMFFGNKEVTAIFIGKGQADGAGVTVANDALCVPQRHCGGETGAVCRSDEFCKHPIGACTTGAAGTCAEKPPTCPAIKNEVCGCDGTTYDDSWFAYAAGVGTNHTGPCAALR